MPCNILISCLLPLAAVVAVVAVLIVKAKKAADNAAELREALANLHGAYMELEAAKPLRELGLAVSSINHEQKNYMTVISGYAALMLKSKELDEKNRGMLDNIAQAAAKAQELSAGLSEMSRSKLTHENREINLTQSLRSSASPVFNGQKCEFSLRCAEPRDAILINGSPEKLDKAFACAFRNSLEAGARHVGVKTYVYNYMTLTVIEDDGCGCGAERLPQLSAPLFTAKKRAGGLGFGLGLIRAIVETHKGSVGIYSKNLLGGEKQGFSLQIVIPANQKTPYTAAMSEIMVVKEGLSCAPEVLRILKNLKIIPHIAEKTADADFSSRSASLTLITLAAPAQAAQLEAKAGGSPSIKVLTIESAEAGALIVGDGGEKELFTEEYAVRRLCGDG